MTVQEYISDKLSRFGISDAVLADISIDSGIALDDEYSYYNRESVGKALCHAVAELIFAPRTQSVSESGFSESVNYDNLGKFYMYLCRKWGEKPDDEIVSLLGLNVITDKTDIW